MARTKLTIADLFETKSIQAIRLSPGGSAGVITLRTANVEKQRNDFTLWLWRKDDDSVVRITKGPADSSAQWLDETTVLFSSRKREEDEDKADKPFPKTRLYTISTRGGEPMLRATLDGVVWDMDASADGRKLVFSFSPNPRVDKKQAAVWEKAPRPTIPARMRWKMDGFGVLPEELPQIHMLAMKGNSWTKPKRIAADAGRWLSVPRWVPGSDRVLYFSADNDSKFAEAHLMLASVGGGKPVRLMAPHAEVLAMAPSPDGKSVAICGNTDLKRGSYLPIDLVVRSLDPKDKSWRTVLATDGNLGEQRTLSDLLPAGGGHLRWQDDDTLVLLHSVGGETHLIRVDEQTGGFDVLAGAGGVAHAFDIAGGTLLYAYAEPGNPGEVYRAGNAKPLSAFNTAVAPKYDIVPKRWWTPTDRGVRVDSWLWATNRQLAAPKKSLPLIVYVHGGPMVQAGHSPFHEYTWLAQNGYAVATCNPRGSTGYGARHGAAIYGEWGDKDMRDILAVREEALRRFPQFDPKRTFIMGGSYGGYTTNWMITHKPGLFRAAVTDRCVANSLSFAGTSDFSNVFPPSEMGLDNIWANPAKVWKESPLSLLPKVTEPLLIIHSDNDWRCPVTQAEELFTGLVELGKKIGEEVRLVMFRGESHGLSRGGRPENRRVRLEENLAWIKKHDKPRKP